MISRPRRWSPTPEQLMVLQELYRKGLRNPNSSQVRTITAHLSLYGKIEGKNVFYWFQNHKARDRQKLRKALLKQMHHRQLPFPGRQDPPPPPSSGGGLSPNDLPLDGGRWLDSGSSQRHHSLVSNPITFLHQVTLTKMLNRISSKSTYCFLVDEDNSESLLTAYTK